MPLLRQLPFHLDSIGWCHFKISGSVRRPTGLRWQRSPRLTHLFPTNKFCPGGLAIPLGGGSQPRCPWPSQSEFY
jgi:hypothetical protein